MSDNESAEDLVVPVTPTAGLPPKHLPGEHFVKGPIPMNWLSAAAAIPGKAVIVALAVWFLAGMKKTSTVKLTRTVLDRFSISRHAAYRCLQRLEAAGLVEVRRHRGRCPVVTLLEGPRSSRSNINGQSPSPPGDDGII
jgi:hypothetical protein